MEIPTYCALFFNQSQEISSKSCLMIGWNFFYAIVRHYNENSAARCPRLTVNRTRNCVHISRVKLKKIFRRSLISLTSHEAEARNEKQNEVNIFLKSATTILLDFFLSKVKCLETQIVEADFLAEHDSSHICHTLPKRIYNSHYSNAVPSMFTS